MSGISRPGARPNRRLRALESESPNTESTPNSAPSRQSNPQSAAAPAQISEPPHETPPSLVTAKQSPAVGQCEAKVQRRIPLLAQHTSEHPRHRVRTDQ